MNSIRKINHWIARFFFIFLMAIGPCLAAPAGTISDLQGDVYLTPAAGKLRPAKKDETFGEGDLISTGKNGEALLHFNDKSLITLRRESSLLVSQFQFGETQKEGFAVKLFKGTLRGISGLIGKTQPQNVKFMTQTATIGIRGTDFEIAIQEEDTQETRAGTYNYVYSGETALGLSETYDQGQLIPVKQEETGLALANPRPGEPALLILKQRPAFLRGGGFDAYMMQITRPFPMLRR